MVISNRDKIEIKKIIQSLDPKEFDGHTEFLNLTLEQRLIWIMQITMFIFQVYDSFLKDKNLY
jgi:hypothetical protein